MDHPPHPEAARADADAGPTPPAPTATGEWPVRPPLHPKDALAADTLEDVLPPAVVLLLGFGCMLCNQIVALLFWPLDRLPLAILAAAILGVFLPVGAVLRALGLPWRRTLWLGGLRFREAAFVTAVLAGSLPPIYALSARTTRWFPPSESQIDFYWALLPRGWPSAIGGLLAVAVVAPLAEELLFRRLVMGALLRWCPPAIAIVVSGVLFGAFHASLWMLLPLSILGVLLGILAWRTQRLTSAWLGHGLFNLAAYVDLWVTRDPRGEHLEEWASRTAVWLPGTVLLGVALWTAGRDRGRPVT